MATDDERAEVAHLVRRAAFGAPPEQVDALAAGGYEAAVDALCRFDGPDPGAEAVAAPTFDPAAVVGARSDDPDTARAAGEALRRERQALVAWWVRRMVAADHPLRERLTLHWHDHFATSLRKVRLAVLMQQHHATLHAHGSGRFDALVGAVARDPAMLIWLDGRENRAGAPNENFARELFELFVLGHARDAGGHGDRGSHDAYGEADVAAAARALTGWRIDRATLTGVLDDGRHDGGTKTVLGVTGRLGLDDVVAVATAHPACAPHVVAGLWSRLAWPAGPDEPVVVDLAGTFAADGDIAALVRRILLHPAFRGPEGRQRLVRSPVEHLVGLCRTLGVAPGAAELRGLAAQGQVPFVPPDVDGWPSGEGWLSTSGMQARAALAAGVARRAAPSLGAGGPDGRPDALARLLGVERWGTATTAALRAAPDDETALALAAAAPEYVVC